MRSVATIVFGELTIATLPTWLHLCNTNEAIGPRPKRLRRISKLTTSSAAACRTLTVPAYTAPLKGRDRLWREPLMYLYVTMTRIHHRESWNRAKFQPHQ